ncbi:RNA polymerase sigma-70 factor, ECF subfamily [Caldanaerovirga acetigignens]|uniref:RNA polymerase sigma-70 factor, ECF subfamily n=1 Tax=Caldanaerovirga acetigignens TaxID=447595 RepID=A0A1M7M7D8_9FIRM|nr:sigma-70 family RNA polymerase sigma factor [Caldanaerovirga acetigignens]SHM86559.1 RNA polymerase sigma-70 factor, ECF subfamily [Caldanaerovirga acetigignens]
MWQDLFKLVFHYLLSLGISKADAEDIAQETLLSTYLHLDGIQEGKLKYYVLATAKNKFIDFMRRNKKEIAVSSFDDLQNFSPICNIEDKEAIKDVVNKLTPSEKKLFYLKYNLEMTNSDIAILLNTNTDSVKSMLWRLRKKIKEYLEEEAKS